MMSTPRTLVVVAIAAVFGVAVSIAQGSGTVGAIEGAKAADPLSGTWRTAPVPMSRIRAAILAAHFTNADVNAFLTRLHFTNAKSLQFSDHFFVYGGKTPKVEQKFWDSSKPAPCCGDQGPYELLSNRRVAITSDDPAVNKYRYVFSYRVQGKTLTLRFLSGTNPSLSKKELRFDKVVMVATAAAPYVRFR